MIDCKECSDYVNNLFNRGEITKEEINKIIIDRHLLKGCDKKNDVFLDWLEFAITNQKQLQSEFLFPEWNKGYLEGLNDAKKHYMDAVFSNDEIK